VGQEHDAVIKKEADARLKAEQLAEERWQPSP
jgi:hypothetical protein